MTSKLTRVRLQEIAEDGFLKHGESKELARMALAEKASEPVILYRERNPYNGLTTGWQELTENEFSFLKENAGENAEFLTLYRHAQPAQVVPDEKDKTVDADDHPLLWSFNEGWNACRAAMLQGAENTESRCSNSPVIPDGWACNDKANAALMMLDRIETADPVDDDRIDGIKRIVRELVAAKQPQNAPQNIPEIIPDGWIPVSEHLPKEKGVYQVWNGKYVDNVPFWFGSFQSLHSELITHWMPLPAEPQEVKSES